MTPGQYREITKIVQFDYIPALCAKIEKVSDQVNE